MDELKVRIVTLPPLRVASVLGFGREPETAAWNKLVAWAGPKGLMDEAARPQVFGFNNPNPSPGSPNYGYEFWLVVGPEIQPEGEVNLKQFPGGLYAVTRCEAGNKPGETIPATWKQLVLWGEASRYKSAGHQWLEEHVAGGGENNLVLDLYMPIAG